MRLQIDGRVYRYGPPVRLKRTSMMRLFARRRDSRPSSEPRLGPARSADRPDRRARRRARPEAEALDRACSWPRQPGYGRRDRVVRPVRPRRAGPETLLRSGPDPRHLRGDRHRRAGRPGARIRASATWRPARPSEADTRFDIGSVTKTFTAIGVLLLYQESQGTSHPLDLNAPISDYLHNTPSFKLPRKWSGVTTMELLNMTSGIRDVGRAPSPGRPSSSRSRMHPLLFTPGTKTSYSDTNLRPARRAHRAVDRGKVRHLHPGPDPGTARDVPDPGAGPVRHGPEPGGRLQRAQAREVAEGRGAERTGDVRRRRDGLDGPGHGHLYDGTPERSSPRSRDLSR